MRNTWTLQLTLTSNNAVDFNAYLFGQYAEHDLSAMQLFQSKITVACVDSSQMHTAQDRGDARERTF